MSVIVSRALPDARDGLKPVHRRILYAMHQTNNYHDKPYKKSARVVGEVIGKYHPHGNDPIYMALVRMAQPFSLREPLIDGQGNFGSMDGDAPAAMRYTEARLSKIAAMILEDIEQDTVNFIDNYDGSEQEPVVLPSRFPNIIVNGTSGIAVGMATNIPPHNLREVIDACCAYIENPDITSEELVQIVPAPDFPTGGIIVGGARAKQALITGKGVISIRAKLHTEEVGNHNIIVVSEVPYQVNKAELVRKIEELSKNKIIEGISELRDETNKLGVRVVIELKRDVIPDVIINQLYKHTDLQTSFGVNMLALNKGIPVLMGIKAIISSFIEFRHEVVTRRTAFELNKARTRAHNLIGLFIAVANIDEVIQLIKSSANPAIAKQALMERDWVCQEIEHWLKLVEDYRNEVINGRCKFTSEQADAILEMKLARLTGLERQKIEGELTELAESIKSLLAILNSKELLEGIILKELKEVREAFGSDRLTQISEEMGDLDVEDLIQREDMVITTTLAGYIKRVPLATYRQQRRGGKGRAAMTTYEDDATTDVIVASTHTPLLFFSTHGKVYRMKAYKLPMGSPTSRGKAMVNLLPLAQNEKITNIVPLPEDPAKWAELSILFSTKKGNVRRNDLDIFSNIQSNGKIAIRLEEGDELVGVAICNESDHALLVTKHGKALRMEISALRIFKGRNSDGVRGIKFASAGDVVVSMGIVCDAKVALEKRDEYLKIPDNIKVAFRASGDQDKFKADIAASGVVLEKITFEDICELANKERFVLTVTENGYGKRTSVYEYRVTGRGGQGVMNIDTSKRNGNVVTSLQVGDADQVMLLTDGGTLIRTSVDAIRITGRNAQGVRIIETKEGEKVISVTRIVDQEEAEQEVEQAAELVE